MPTTSKHTPRRSKKPTHIVEHDYSEYFGPDEPAPEPPKRRSSKAGKPGPTATDRATSTGPSSPKRKSMTASAVPESQRHRSAAASEAKPSRVNPGDRPAHVADPATANCLSEFAGRANENIVGCNRVLKASVQFAQNAGRALSEARALLGENQFNGWLEGTLPICRNEAMSLIRFSEDPRVAGADVSPTTAMPVRQAAELVAPLCRHLVGQPAAPDTADPEARRKGRRPRRPR